MRRQHHLPTWILRSLAIAGWMLAAAAPALAVDDRVAFLRALQDRGYGELAADFLTGLKDQGKLGERLEKVFEIELVACMRIAAQETKDTAEALRRLSSAQAHVSAFLQQNPQGLLAAKAQAAGGNIELDRAQLLLAAPSGRADAGSDASESAKADALAAFERARTCFTQALQLCRSIPAKVPDEATVIIDKGRATRPKPPGNQKAVADREADEAEDLSLDCRFKLAFIDYQIARTCYDRKNPARDKALKNAAKAFDAIYQQYRIYRSGLYAHLWHGKTLAELADWSTALAVYDEVLAGAPDEGQPRPDRAMEELYAEAEYARLALLARQDAIEQAAKLAADQRAQENGGMRVITAAPKQNRLQQIANEAEKWLRANEPASFTSGYQGVRLEHAKALIALATKHNDQAAWQTAFNSLADVAKLPGPHQAEALQLRSRYATQAGKVELRSFAEAITIADAAASAGLWDDAVAAYNRAVELAGAGTAANDLLLARFRLARAHYFAGKPETALDVAEELARSHPEHALAPSAAVLAVRAASALTATAKDKAAAEQRLTRLADFVSKQWPNRAEVDDVRLMLGEAALTRGDCALALKFFDGVNASSSRYPAARFLSAQTHWQLYLDEKKKPPEARNKDLISAERLSAITMLNAGLQRPGPAPSDDGVPADLAARSRLLLAEIHIEAGEVDKSLEVMKPLLDELDDRSSMSAATASRVLRGAIRAYLAKKDIAAASKAATRLAQIGEDSPQVNAVLAEVVGVLAQEWKRDLAAARSPTPQAPPKSADEMAASSDLLMKFLKQLTSRRNHTLAGSLIVADACFELGNAEQARTIYQGILQRAEDDPAAKKAYAPVVARARTQLVGFLRAEKKYAEALGEAERLAAENPKALGPMLEQGRILQAWGETEPKRYEQALAVWTPIRLAMQRMPQKTPEYYEVVYNAAFCLVQKYARSKDGNDLSEARQLLKSTLTLSPQLSGPDMVAKYKALLDKCRFLQEHKL